MKRVVILRTIVVTLVVVSYFLLQNLLNNEKRIEDISGGFCDFSLASCFNTANTANIGLSVDKPMLPLETELTFQLSGDVVKYDIKSAYIYGINMYMGKIPLFFNTNESGKFEAATMLGICSEREMRWGFKLELQHKETKEMISNHYEFRTSR